jgi:hypothetical protein
LVPETATATPLPVAQPTQPLLQPTPSQGAITRHFDQTLPDFRFGQSGNSCDLIAADLRNQKITGTLTAFPNLEQNQLRAVTDDTRYRATASRLDSNCQPAGQQFDLTADLGADYSATLGKTGTARCIQESQLVVTKFSLQGLPGPLNSLAESTIQSSLGDLVTPYIDQAIVQLLNGGKMPPSGARCP